MVTAGNRRNFRRALVVLALVALGLHLPAWAIVSHYGDAGIDPSIDQLVSVSVIVVLYFSLLLSQSLEQVTRTLYSRGDLDLVMSSPVKPRTLFAVRIASNVVLMSMMALVLSAPFVNMLTLAGGPRWLVAYPVAVAVAAVTGSMAVAITIGLFRLLGPKRTRLVAQIVAAIVGAGFAIGIQVFAIVNYGQLMQAGLLVTPGVVAMFPPIDSVVWLPARGIMGDVGAMAVVVAVALVVVALVIWAFAPRLGEHSIAATDLAIGHSRKKPERAFAVQSPRWAMRRKEWLLLRRDPWLVSQTLTQLLYLIPPALLLAHGFGNSAGSLVIVVMVLVTVGGQLGGALGWLAISGEDAPEFVATAPVPAGAIVRGKVEAVMGTLALGLGPLVVGLAFLSPRHAAFAALGLAVSAGSTLQIQLWFRAQARRTHFRRRHTSSRIATLSEALVSFSWAAAFGLAAAGSWFAAISAVIAILIMAGARAVSPRKALV
jgi:ABC-2 type transport system permease protein